MKGIERFVHWLVPLIVIGFASGAIYYSTTFKKMPPILKRGIQPSDFPQLVSALIILLAILLVWRDPVKLAGRVNLMVWLTMGVMLGFVLLVQIDFFLALGISAILIAVLWGERRIFKIALIGLVTPAVIFFMFDFIFKIRFPRGLLTSIWYG